METTNNTTLTTAAAWRAAISLTCADVRAFLRSAFEVLKCIGAFLYLAVALCLTLNENDESLLLNFSGLILFFIAYLFVKRDKYM